MTSPAANYVFYQPSNILLIRSNFFFCSRWERLLRCFGEYNYNRTLLRWHEKYGWCVESVRMSSLTAGHPSVPISKVDIKHVENKITRTKCRFYNQTASVISVYKLSSCITSKYQLCITGSLHLWYNTTHQIAICCGSGYPCWKKKMEAVQTPARKVSQMVWMRTVITYLVAGLSERGQRERKKMGNEISKSGKKNRGKARGRKKRQK